MAETVARRMPRRYIGVHNVMLTRLLKPFRRPAAPPARVPVGEAVYVVGDIHGRADLLARLHVMMTEDAAAFDAANPGGGDQRTIVYLGDFVDRGPGSREVIDAMIGRPVPGFRAVHLRGNHEDMMFKFLYDLRVGLVWLANGGAETLTSYGIEFDDAPNEIERFKQAQYELRRRLPSAHFSFLQGLPYYAVVGDYAFVHAGIRPGVALADQNPTEMIWMRDPFLGSTARHPQVVVHGHSITSEAEFRANRIGIDTGAYKSDTLTCLVLRGEERKLLQT